jgi:hypothetical protein
VKFTVDSLLYDFLANIERGYLLDAAAVIEGEVLTWRAQGISNPLKKQNYSAHEFVTQVSDCEIRAIERLSSVPAKFNIRWDCDVKIVDDVTYTNGGYNARIEIQEKLKIYQFIMDESVDEERSVTGVTSANG